MKIAIQGNPGSFHHIAAEHYFNADASQHIDYIFADTFSAVFTALEAGAAETAVIAIENSLYGSIPEVYKLLQKYKFPIVGEVDEHINQNLIAFPGAKYEDIRSIYSHPVALAQCAHFLASEFPRAEIIEHSDTAAAVQHIKREGNHHAAAIAGAQAARLHKMTILQANIQDEPLNFTRFLVIQPNGKPPADANKASIILETAHTPGALYRALGVFDAAGANLTKLRSRPIPGEIWKYMFYVDLEIADAATFMTISSQLEEQGCTVMQLGIYQAAVTMYDD
jgi:prephenate dehydratase